VTSVDHTAGRSGSRGRRCAPARAWVVDLSRCLLLRRRRAVGRRAGCGV